MPKTPHVIHPYETRMPIGVEQVAGSGPELEVENPCHESLLARVGAPAPDQPVRALAVARGIRQLRCLPLRCGRPAADGL